MNYVYRVYLIEGDSFLCNNYMPEGSLFKFVECEDVAAIWIPLTNIQSIKKYD